MLKVKIMVIFQGFIMAKKIVIENQKGVDPKYNTWAMEALDEMLNLFPEFKDKFEVEARGNFKPQGSEIEQADFDNLPDDNAKKLYIKLPSGKYLVPHASTDWYVEQTKLLSENNGFDSEIMTKLRADSNAPEKPLTIMLACDEFAPLCSGYGVQNLGTSITTQDMDNKDFFKNVIKHELGHVFRATYSERSNIVEQSGQHCTNADCIMEAYGPNFETHLSQPLAKPFCDECIESMRENLRDLLENENSLTVNGNSLPETNHVDSSWKEPLRKFYTQSATDKGLQYVENVASKNFQAQLKNNDGSVTNIEASNLNTVALSAVDKDGKSKVPNQEIFDDQVKYARKNNLTAIKIGNIKTPEFKARLVLACMSANPPMPMVNAPTLNDEFFKGVDTATRTKIEALAQQQQNQNSNPNPAPNPAPVGGKPFIISRDKAIADLTQKETLGTIIPSEQKMLDYARTLKKSGEEYEAAVQRTGDNIDPRTAEHSQRTGLKPQTYKFYNKTRKSVTAWKLHLDVMPNRNDPSTKAISEMLEKLDIDHKVLGGGENGKGMTIYVGGYEDAKRLSKEINKRFGTEIAEPPVYTNQVGQEMMFNHVTSGRFLLQGVFETQYPHGTVEGICPATYGANEDKKSEKFIFDEAVKKGIIPSGTNASECFGDENNCDFEKKYTFDALEAYCAHKLYEKHMGQYYNGKNPDLHEQKMFENIIPTAGTPERAKWDKIADKFEKHIAKEYPRGIAEMQRMVTNYTPVDFNKLPPFNNNQNNNNNNGRP